MRYHPDCNFSFLAVRLLTSHDSKHLDVFIVLNVPVEIGIYGAYVEVSASYRHPVVQFVYFKG
jgi:hypothetical protein